MHDAAQKLSRRGSIFSALIGFFAAGPEAALITDPALVDRTYKRKRVWVMLAITLGYAAGYTCRLGLSVVKKPLIDAGVFSPDQFGIIGSAIFYGYAAGKLFNGFLADHANIKRFFPFGIAISALINIAMGGSTLLWLWVVLWGLNGWFQGFGAASSVVTLSNWFSNRERGRFYGMWSTAHSLGEGLTFIVSAYLVSWFGWRGGFAGPGLFCLVMAVVMYLTLEDRPQTIGLPAVADWRNDHAPVHPPSVSTGRLQLAMVKLPAVWILALSSACMYVPRYAINSWGVLYLQEAKGYELIMAGRLLAVNTAAGIAGCIAFGFISDKLFDARRPPVNLIFGVVEILGLLGFLAVPAQHPWLAGGTLAVFGFGMAGTITSLGGLFAVDLAPKRAAGAAMGVIGVASYIGAALQERASGYLIDRHIFVVDGVRHYNFGPAATLWLGASVASLLVAVTLWRAKPAD